MLVLKLVKKFNTSQIWLLLFFFCSKFEEIECLYLNLVVGGVLVTCQDGDVALLEPVVHHEVVVPDADGPQGLPQGGG